MPVLFVATDFSPISDNAAFYGAALAGQWGYELRLIHSYFIPLTFNDPAMPILPMDDLKNSADEHMAHTVAKINAAFPQLAVTGHVDYGDIQDTIEDAVDEFDPSLLVVGSHGEADADMWMGSTTLSLLRHCKCPVLAVPPTAKFTPVQKICLAVDLNHESDELPLNAINELQNLCNASLHLVHVLKVGEEATTNIEDSSMVQQLRAINVNLHQLETAGDIDTKIAEFSEAQGMQWLAVIPHHHSFWDSIFHKSHTKAVVKHSHIPVLALHQ